MCKLNYVTCHESLNISHVTWDDVELYRISRKFEYITCHMRWRRIIPQSCHESLNISISHVTRDGVELYHSHESLPIRLHMSYDLSGIICINMLYLITHVIVIISSQEYGAMPCVCTVYIMPRRLSLSTQVPVHAITDHSQSAKLVCPYFVSPSQTWRTAAEAGIHLSFTQTLTASAQSGSFLPWPRGTKGRTS